MRQRVEGSKSFIAGRAIDAPGRRPTGEGIGSLQAAIGMPVAAEAVTPGKQDDRLERIMPMIVHLVDGTYELFRHFYGLRRFTKTDRPLGAVVGVLQSVLEMIEQGATHVGVATDHVIESFRNDLWPGYKTGAGIEPALWAQFHPLEEALVAMGVVTWPMVELEADDALASAAISPPRRRRSRRSASGPPTRTSRNACARTAWCRSTVAARRSAMRPACAPSSASRRS
jgi:hypothetical protein